MTKQQVDRIRKEYGDEYLYRQLAEECMELGHATLNDMLDGQMTVCARSAGHTAKEQTERCVQCGYTSDVGWEYCPHCGHWKYWGKE